MSKISSLKTLPSHPKSRNNLTFLNITYCVTNSLVSVAVHCFGPVGQLAETGRRRSLRGSAGRGELELEGGLSRWSVLKRGWT